MPLFRSELLRARSRRLVVLVFVAIVAGPLVGVLLGALNSHKPPERQLAADRQRYEQELAACEAGSYLPPGSDLPPGYTDLASFCADAVRPGYFASSGGLRLSGLDPIAQGTATIVIGLAVVLGASLVGADWSTGTMATLLTWESRRGRVFLVRAVVVVVVAALMAVVGECVLAVSYRLAVAARGTADIEVWLGPAARTIGRIAVLAGIWGVLAYATGSIARSTAGGVGILLGELVLVEGFLRGFKPSIARWTLIQNSSAWASHTSYPSDPSGAYFGPVLGITTPTEALATLVIVVGVVALVAAMLFVRRDVT